MALSEAQLNANRANAKKSTGPRTPEGKDVSRLNAITHGVTRQVMTMPAPQMQAYLDFNEEQFKAYKPADAIDKQIVQTVVDTQWRLNSARTIEFSILSEGFDKAEGMYETDSPAVEAAMVAPKTVEKKLHMLKLLSLYEQRHNRTLQNAMKQYAERQEAREKREAKEMHEASIIEQMMKMKGQAYDPKDDGFVFSSKRYEVFKVRQAHLREAALAEKVGFNAARFRAASAKQ